MESIIEKEYDLSYEISQCEQIQKNKNYEAANSIFPSLLSLVKENLLKGNNWGYPHLIDDRLQDDAICKLLVKRFREKTGKHINLRSGFYSVGL